MNGLISDYTSGKFSDSQAVFFSDNSPTMSSAEEKFRAQIEQNLSKFSDKPFAAERALGLPQDSIRSLFRGNRKAGTSLNRAQELCDAFGLELYIGPKRPKPGAGGFAEAIEPFVSMDGDRKALEKGYLPVPFHPSDLVHKDLSGFAIARAWIESEGLHADELYGVVNPNEDMTPSIPEGEFLLIDSSFEPETRPTLCAVLDGSRIRIGWLTQPSAGTYVVFFHRSFTPPLVHRGKLGLGLKCLGRVVSRITRDPDSMLDENELRRLVTLAKEMTRARP